MSRDIRSWFQPKKVQQVQKIEDDDEIPESPEVQIKIKKNAAGKRKKRIISDESDEEIFKSKKTKTNGESNETRSQSKNKNKTPSKMNLKEVKAVDIFGNKPVKRTEPIVTKTKKQTEVGIHSDEDFDKSLLELDEFEEVSVKKQKQTSTNKTNGVNGDETEKTEKSHKKLKLESVKDGTKKEVKIAVTEKVSQLPIKRETKKQKSPRKTSSNNKVAENKKEPKKEEPCNYDSKMTNHVDSKTNGKRDFSEFNNVSLIENSDEETPKKKKTNKSIHNKSLNESVLTDEERHERKRYSAGLYQKYLNRSGPKHLGAKEIPEGSPDCLKDCAFLLTGVLDSFERDEIVAAVTKYGGTIKNSMSKKVTHVLAGEDAGPAKMAKAQELGVKIINEDEFLQMISGPAKKGDNKVENKKSDKEIKKDKSPVTKPNKDKDKSKTKDGETGHKTKKESSSNHVKHSKSEINHVINKKEDKSSKEKGKPNSSMKKLDSESLSKTEVKNVKEVVETAKSEAGSSSKESFSKQVDTNSMMWVDKYKPQNIKQIIGQHGDASNVKKLMSWLTKWYINRKAKIPKPSPWAKNDDGAYYKAALLSGPPGVGKTTTVSLVCKELGFDMVEFNASDTRSKTLIREQIGELLTTTSLSAYAKGDTGKQAVTKKHVLVMDEVDGMAGNEDRGGLQELIGLIKSTSVPIICMCNDRNSQKMRSLVNYCYDLRFSRPRVDQIKSAMMSICFKEGIKIPPDVLTQMITAVNQDVRQTLHMLSMWAVEPALSSAEQLRKDAGNIRTDIKLGPWEAIRKVFSAEEHKHMSINDKSDLFFYDYSLAPLFVQENYLQVAPHCPKNEVLDRVSQAADSISMGDLVDAKIRGSQSWGLLPIQAMYSSVIPGSHLSGHLTGQIQFPAWLGKNSRATKMNRMAQEIHAHTRLSTSGSKSSIFLDYSSHLRDAILTPLIKDKLDGIDRCMQVLEAYHLLRDDLDSLVELSTWPGQRNPMVLIDSKVKAAMTRTYNKQANALPYAPAAVKRVRAREDDGQEEEREEDHEQSDSDPENDALIKVQKKKKEAEKPGSSKEKPSTGKSKGTSSKGKKK